MEKSPISITRYGEKGLIIKGLKEKQQQKPDLRFASSPHFTVVYQDLKQTGQKLEPFMDTDPASLAKILEYSLPRVLNHFQIRDNNSLQVVDVAGSPKDGRNSKLAGSYDGESSNEHKIRSPKHAKFSRAFPVKGQSGPYPYFYSSAVHEAIGHGFVEQELLAAWTPDGQNPYFFMAEGIANYVTDYVLRINPHVEFGNELLNLYDAIDNMTNNDLSNPLSPFRAKAFAQRILDGFDFSLSQAFDLKNAFGQQPSDKTKWVPNNYYLRGPSFVKYFIDTYGMQNFHAITSGLNLKQPNFYRALIDVTQKPLEEIREEWKNTVLKKGIMRNFDPGNSPYRSSAARLISVVSQ